MTSWRLLQSTPPIYASGKLTTGTYSQWASGCKAYHVSGRNRRYVPACPPQQKDRQGRSFFRARVGRYCLERIPGVCPAVVACRPAGTLRTWQRRTSAMAFRGRFCGPRRLWALDIAEGTRKTEGGRYWQVDVKPASEARQDANTRQAEAKQQRAAERRTAELESDRKELVRILTEAHEPETKTRLRDMSFGGARFNRAFGGLAGDGTLEPVELPSRITVPTRRGNCANRQTITPND